MPDIFLIGGSPSSGSSLLVNLLSHHKNILCLPETGLFVHGKYLIAGSDKEQEKELNLNAFLPWLSTQAKVSQAIGLDSNTFDQALEAFPTAFELLRAFVDSGRTTYLVEKTPENIFAFHPYLSDSQDNKVVVTIRDALSVTQSLCRRGFNIIESLLLWFSHSYETARLIRDFSGQVYACTYDQLTKEPARTVDEIIAFWGVSAGKKPEMPIVQGGTGQSSISHSYENSDMIDFLVDYSNWNLADTAWTKSPNARVRYTEPVNLLGLKYQLLAEQLLFKTADDGFLTISSLENYITGRGASLIPTDGSGTSSLEIAIRSELIRCLHECYPPFITKA